MSIHPRHLRRKKRDGGGTHTTVMPGQTQVTKNCINKKCADDWRKQHQQINQSDSEWSCGWSENFYNIIDEWHCAREKNTFTVRIIDTVLRPIVRVEFYVVKCFIIN